MDVSKLVIEEFDMAGAKGILGRDDKFLSGFDMLADKLEDARNFPAFSYQMLLVQRFRVNATDSGYFEYRGFSWCPSSRLEADSVETIYSIVQAILSSAGRGGLYPFPV